MGIIDILNNALDSWNQKLSEIWQIITQSPESFKGGGIGKALIDHVKALARQLD